MTELAFFPIGSPGRPWDAREKAEWRSQQVRRRRYDADVLPVVDRLRERFDVESYGRLDYAPDVYELFAIRSRDWRDDLPCALVTGGVHGYETSGVLGALQFAEQHAADYAGRVNLLIAPCVSPWADDHFGTPQVWRFPPCPDGRIRVHPGPGGERHHFARCLHPRQPWWRPGRPRRSGGLR